ncbi:MAG: lactate utilization protein [Proteobacteria bacterium]|nr:lactate utilization protein [Pseudomonadota bacterium]MBU4470548.1 lactate utilization protein [Pseudomonadota bacterium]MCG2751384.1 lactate utilization protein [Desulfobacteraceae bacterium]
MEIKTEQFVDVAKKEMQNTRTRQFLRLLPSGISRMRDRAMQSFPDPDAANEYSRAIRAEVIARMPELLEEFDKNATANGAKIVWAKTAAEANAFIVNLAKERGVTYVTKGKSMITEEMGLNDALGENGIEPFESDLGEFIAQQLHRPPFHIVGPAINVPVEEINELFLAKANMKEPTTDPVKLGYAARLYLRDKFHHLAMGITGVNMAIAETGTILNVENEGNIRMSKSSPKIQVSVMSLEKVVPTMADAMHLIRLLCRNCTGQKLAAYISMDSGPKKQDEVDGPEELYIIILDNGRTEIYQDVQAREALRCIRCGACLNTCPIYSKIGGYPYGWAYSGPMGQVLTPLLLGLNRTRDLFHACTLCSACKSICPAGIDHPKMFLHYRMLEARGNKHKTGGLIPDKATKLFDLWGWGAARAWRWKIAVKTVRPFINRYAKDGVIQKAMAPLDGWFRTRDFPAMSKKTFHERWAKIKKGE